MQPLEGKKKRKKKEKKKEKTREQREGSQVVLETEGTRTREDLSFFCPRSFLLSFFICFDLF